MDKEYVMNGNTENEYSFDRPLSFWHSLGKWTFVIPVIQRDYAQGRRGKEELRKEFFGQLITALSSGKNVRLDFVYGCPDPERAEAGVIYPLDGQQRLTSLWLLHWYLAFLTNSLNDAEVTKRLLRFSYETRTSSREFCQRLCQPFKGVPKVGESISRFIKNQPWFSRRFKQDPTINAMLRSLSDPVENSGFEQIINGYSPENLWKAAIADQCPVTFYFRDTIGEKIVNPDDLYIKMNARGKKLTDFENFKSELFSFKDKNEVEIFRDNSISFVSKFENAWTNLFWSLRHKDRNVIDDLFFEFFNRLSLNYIIEKGTTDAKDSLYKHITGHKAFANIAVYQEVLVSEFRDSFANILNGIVKTAPYGSKINAIFEEPYDFPFLPDYAYEPRANYYEIEYREEKFWVSETSVRNQVLTYAASIYFSSLSKEKAEFNSVYFRDWMIFARNMFYSQGIDAYLNSRTLLSLFKEIGVHSLDIVTFLSADELPITPTVAKEQFAEEREKALKIRMSRDKVSGIAVNYELLIRDAEVRYPFDGMCRFLFRNAEGEYDWKDFPVKKSNFDKILEQKPIGDKQLSPLALRSLFKYLKWEEFGIPCLNSHYDSWKSILKNESFCHAVHELLKNGIDSEETLKKFKSPLSDSVQKGTHEDLVSTRFLHQTTWGEFTFRAWGHFVMINRSSVDWKRYFLGTPRNRLIAEGVKRKDIVDDQVDESHLLGDREHLWGESFYFNLTDNLGGKYIFWWNSTQIKRLADENVNSCDIYLRHRRAPHYNFLDRKNPENYGINIPQDCKYEDFIKSLRALLDRAYSK